ncbi:glycine betaine ABC transporter substrate-binding protein [Lentibacillus sp. Marseille-P4043]|uniref:glycine betaine ABC transporter substrate-binding protein n=1 Tax=Lentibacillus sp. Marseille-P4043 TaxID=2040293 RepID=UPI001F35536F|nr:glycine betaine ABC transporter substrate-binding protein [Lentibacillus sp. Marseille-P4043]
MFFKKLNVGILFILLVVLTACGSTSNGEEKDSSETDEVQTIKMGQINWAENVAVTNMWKVILEDEGYDLELKLLDMGAQMAGVANGDLDVSPEVWLPIQDASYLERYQDEANFSEESWYDNAKVGLVVPEYMEDINSIEDLNAHKDEFEGEITGFEPGAGTMVVTGEMIDEYDLDFELIQSSESAMIASIGKAIDNNKPIVAPLWSPHRVFSEMDLKYLDDPKKTYGEAEKIYHATRHGFADDFPKVDKWLKNWKLNDDQIGELMSMVNEANDPADGAAKWVEKNQELVDEWLEK